MDEIKHAQRFKHDYARAKLRGFFQFRPLIWKCFVQLANCWIPISLRLSVSSRFLSGTNCSSAGKPKEQGFEIAFPWRVHLGN
jgi:hypothetical protein